jgi:hypothetical protein
MQQWQFELANNGYLILPADVATAYFPEDACVALWRQPELWLMPLRAQNSGGLLMKQRNARGDRSVLVHESLPTPCPTGVFTAFWDSENHAVRIAIGNDRT